MVRTKVEDLIREALIYAAEIGHSKVDFDSSVERVKENSSEWEALRENNELG